MSQHPNFEQQLCAKIEQEFDAEKAKSLISAYNLTRSKLENHIYNEIKGVEPSLSDHSGDHIANVLDNAFDLLSENGEITCLSAIELYCLGMMILFHDVGNLFGRDDHQNRIAEVYDWARGTDSDVRPEKTLVLTAARAHTGLAADGSRDTLNPLGNNEHLERKRVRLRELAAILRFADELAEGPQRTSEFMRTRGLYDDSSGVFHDYASITHVFIDRGNERIALKYEIDIETTGSGEERRKKLADLLQFVYTRIQKLDQERRYASYYSKVLAPFKSTEVTFNFHCRGEILALDLQPLRLTDKVVPGDPVKNIAELDPSYAIDRLVTDLLSRCQGEGDVAET